MKARGERGLEARRWPGGAALLKRERECAVEWSAEKRERESELSVSSGDLE